MKRKLLAGLMSTLLLCVTLPMIAIPVTAKSENGLEYEITDEEVTITGYTSDLPSELVIPDTIEGFVVTGIGNNAFSRCRFLRSVTIPDSVKTIGNSAFCDCERLSAVTIGSGVIVIGEDAFADCFVITDVYISDIAAWCNIDFAHLKSNPLYGADNLYHNDMLVTDLIVPDGVTTIGNYVFSKQASLYSIDIPASVTTIKDDAFFYCNDLTTINVDTNNPYYCSVDGVLFDKGKTVVIKFPGEKSASSYVFPDSVKVIKKNAFSYCRFLETVSIGDNVEIIGEGAFFYCESLTSITIPDSVTAIEAEAFYWCSSLKSATIGDGVTIIGSFAFYMSSLETVNIGRSVENIGESVFSWCYNLASITIPASVKSIGYMAFSGCESLSDVYYGGSEQDRATITIGANNNYFTNATWHYNYTPEPDVLYGDANGDGRINNKDLGLLQQYLAEWNVELNLDACDVNNDGKVNNKDLGLLQQYLADWDVELG